MPDEVARRDNAGKPELSYILDMGPAIRNLARVFEQGAKKYERDNWKKGGKPDTEYLNSALRHLLAFASGEFYDPETGCPHLAHADWNIQALQTLNYADKPSLDPEFETSETVEEDFIIGDYVTGIGFGTRMLHRGTYIRKYERLLKSHVMWSNNFNHEVVVEDVERA